MDAREEQKIFKNTRKLYESNEKSKVLRQRPGIQTKRIVC